jgi:hypothetical protein
MTRDPVTGPVIGQVHATAEGAAAVVALLTAELEAEAPLSQERLIEDVPAAVVLRSLVMFAAALLRAVTDDQGAVVLRSIGEGAVEIAATREARRLLPIRENTRESGAAPAAFPQDDS